MSSSYPQACWVIEGGKMFLRCNSHHYRLSSRVEEPNSGLRELGGSPSGEAGCETWVTGIPSEEDSRMTSFLRDLGNTQEHGILTCWLSVVSTCCDPVPDMSNWREKRLLLAQILEGFSPSWQSSLNGSKRLLSHLAGQLGGRYKDIFLQRPHLVTHCIRQVPPPKVSQFP